MKKEEAVQLLNDMGVALAYGDYTLEKVDKRHYRLFDQYLQISNQDFDKWGVSVEFEIDFSRMKRKRLTRELDNLVGSCGVVGETKHLRGSDSKEGGYSVSEDTKKKFLKCHDHYKDLVETEEGLVAIHWDGEHQHLTPRKIHQMLSRGYGRSYKNYKSNIKKHSNRRNRTATQKHLSHDNYDIFDKNREANNSVVWKWD